MTRPDHGRDHGLSRARTVGGWALAVLGPPALTGVLLLERDNLSLASDLMFFFTLVVATAIVGGLLPSLAAALLASSLLNYFFTEPTRELVVADGEDALALVVFVLVAVAVASVVDVAERRSGQARRARAEAELLADLSRAVLDGGDAPADVAAVLARHAPGHGVRVEERDVATDTWVTVHERPGPADGSTWSAVAGRLRIRVIGPTGLGDARLLDRFTAQASLVLEGRRLRARAARALELEQADATRTAILTTASHDLRTPLAAIRAAVDGLRHDHLLAPEDRVALTRTVEVSTGRLERLVGNLLDLSRLRAGAVRAQLVPVSLDEILPLALDGLADRVQLDLPESLPLAWTDAVLLERVVANLASNAARHAGPGARPLVAARAGDDALVVTVVDDGPGIAPADRERVFQAFERLGAGADHPAGMGLGLAVVRGLAEAIDAEVSLRDTEGGGLTAVVRVPRADAR